MKHRNSRHDVPNPLTVGTPLATEVAEASEVATSENGDSPHEIVAARAFAIWTEEGYPDGRALEHWLRAEKECAINHVG